MNRVRRVPQDLLPGLFRAGVAAVAPGPAVRRALETADLPDGSWTRILALGKAAAPMAAAAVESLHARGLRVRDGLVVPPYPGGTADGALRVVPGDHPIPGPRSARAAEAVGRFIADGRAGDLVIVLLSGGTTSLIAAPVPGLPAGELVLLYRRLLHAGLPIGAINRVRRRFGRWAGGRLAVALAPAHQLVLAVSDVPGDHLADIGSGPCAPDPDSAASLLEWLKAEKRLDLLPPIAADLLDRQARGQVPDSPQSHDPRFASVESRIVACNRDAVDGVAEAARRLGLLVSGPQPLLQGDAARVGQTVADTLLQAGTLRCLIWGGETTVSIPEGSSGHGGRCQELALAAARVIARATGDLPALLAAGTDGVDGNTDAAGALVTPRTWARIQRAGRDPARDLAAHNSHPSLALAGALLRTGPTGTNVMDLIIGLGR